MTSTVFLQPTVTAPEAWALQTEVAKDEGVSEHSGHSLFRYRVGLGFSQPDIRCCHAAASRTPACTSMS